MRILTEDVAFKSYEVKNTKQTIEKEITFQDNITQTDEIKEISYHTTINNEFLIPTIFKDPKNGKPVIVALEENTIEKLSSYFGEDTVIKQSDGSIKLSGDAENFVSGWFGDIAYTREFLKADRDKNGQLDENETLSIKNTVKVTIDLNTNSQIFISDSYITLSKEELELIKNLGMDVTSSLDEELNMTLQFDLNLDGKISLKEVLLSVDETKGFISLEHLQDMEKEGFELSMKDLDKVLSLMDYLRTLFLKLEIEKELIEVVDNSFLHKILQPKDVNKILTEELFEIIVPKKDKIEDNSKKRDSLLSL